MSDVLNSPEMLDWIRCQEKAVQVVKELLHDLGYENPAEREHNARAVFVRLALANITVAWNREENEPT